MAAVLAVTVGLVALPGQAQQTFSLRQGITPSDLRFVGFEDEGVNVVSRLTLDDVALLVATDETRTLNYLIRGGIPVRSSRLAELVNWGLLRQETDGFRSLIPVLRGDRAERFSRMVAAVAPVVAAESQPAMDALSDRLWRHPGVASLPAVTAWMLRDRVWTHLTGPNGLDFDRRIAEQHDAFPERGFWGALWYVQDPAPLAYDFYEWRREDYTFQIAWNHGAGDPLFGASDSDVPLPEILAKLRSNGRRLADREDFPGARAAGLVDAEGNMRVLAREYRLDDEDGLAYLIETAAVAITESVLRHLPVADLAPLLGVRREVAAVIAYTELAPRLVEQFDQRGLLVRVGDPRAQWRAALGGPDGPDDPAGLPQRAAIAGDENEPRAGAPDAPFAAIIWRDLPARRRLRIAWW